MAATAIFLTHAARVTDKDRPDALLLTEVDHLASALVPQVANPPIAQGRTFATGTIQFAVTAGPFLAAASLSGQLPKLLGQQPFLATHPPARDHQCLACIDHHRRLMDLSQVHACFGGSGHCSLDFLHRPDEVELVAVLPHQFDPLGFEIEVHPEDQTLTIPPHGQHQPAAFSLVVNSLRGPIEREELLFSVRVFEPMAAFGFFAAALPGGGHVGEQLVADHLHRLAVQSVAALGVLLKFTAVRPLLARLAGLFVDGHDVVPDPGGFLLGFFYGGLQGGP
jgi:hypothetical protein